MTFRISLAQLHIQLGNTEQNLRRAVEMISASAQSGAQLILLPELWASGYDLERARLHAQASPGVLQELERLSSAHNLVIGGSLLEETDHAVYNTLHWVTPSSSVKPGYRKIHLFELMAEDQFLTAGEHPRQLPAPWGPTGLAICYDLRFPELFRRYALEGAKAIALSAEWPARRSVHWETLLRARAIENQTFVFASNAVGLSGNETFAGRSTIYSPLGDILAQAGSGGEELITADIDPRQVDEVRAFMPILKDRRPQAYGHVLTSLS